MTDVQPKMEKNMLTVAALMQSEPKTVRPDMTLSHLEETFLSSGFTGFPVVEKNRLVGVVSRSDVVRSLLTERSRVEQVSDFYVALGPVSGDTPVESLEKTAAQVGVRIAALKVEDVMIHQVVSIGSSEPIKHLADMMVEGRFHRLPVVDGGRLVGLVTSMDLVRCIAEGRFVESDAAADKTALLE
jgi:CBS domain-containing protein